MLRQEIGNQRDRVLQGDINLKIVLVVYIETGIQVDLAAPFAHPGLVALCPVVDANFGAQHVGLGRAGQ